MDSVGFYLRRRVRLARRSWVNVSKTGVSVSGRAGRVTVNSRGHGRVRLLKGFGWRF